MSELGFSREDILRYWQESDLLRMSFEDAIQTGFKEADAIFLEEHGMPDWSAPNLMIALPPEREDQGMHLIIGEDREDQKIVYDADSGMIFAKSNLDGDLLVASSMTNFVHLLILYARMVDAAIARVGDDAYTENKIPSDLVRQFESEGEKTLGEHRWRNSFWSREVARLGDTEAKS